MSTYVGGDSSSLDISEVVNANFAGIDSLSFDVLALDNLVNFRVDLYTLCVDTFISKFVDINDDIAWYMDIFDKFTKYDRFIANEIRYNDYLRVKKLKLIKKHLL